ncbi:MAG: arylsulfatase [Zavarzinella sp.]
MNIFLSKQVLCILAIMGAVLFAAPLSSAEPAATRLPNIVILYADDMGYGDLGVQNPQSKIPTPNLDRLATQGMRFTDAHSSSGICTPSRYALLQGRYHWRKFHGIVNSFDQPILDDEKQTIAEMLKTKGYSTACIGKWHLGWDWNAIKKAGVKPKGNVGYAPTDFDWSKPIPGGPLSHGFDYYFGDDVPNFPPYAWFENDRVITVPTVSLTTTAKTAEGSWEARKGPSVKDWDFWAVMPELTKKAEQWLGKQQADKPFLLYMPFTSPHAPIVPTKEFTGKSKANGYGDFMVQTDDTVGRILAALEKHGFEKNTLVIFTADNGPERYAYDRIKNFQHRSMGPLRGLKRDLWEGGHRVPFIVKWPGVVPEGKVNDALISQVDLFATIASVVGSQIPAGSAEDSYDQLSTFKGIGTSPRKTIIHNTNANGYAVRHEDWVLIDAKSGGISAVPAWFNQENGYPKNNQPGELYNLANDLAQKQNLYEKMPEKVAELKKILSAVRAKGQVR